MTLTEEDIGKIKALVIEIMKDCDNIGHNYVIINNGAGKKCTRCDDYVCDYETGF